MSTFSRVYKPYTFLFFVVFVLNIFIHLPNSLKHTLSGGGSVKISVHFYRFGLIFIIFMGIFGTQKMLMCTLFGGRGSQKVYDLYIYG